MHASYFKNDTVHLIKFIWCAILFTPSPSLTICRKSAFCWVRLSLMGALLFLQIIGFDHLAEVIVWNCSSVWTLRLSCFLARYKFFHTICIKSLLWYLILISEKIVLSFYSHFIYFVFCFSSPPLGPFHLIIKGNEDFTLALFHSGLSYTAI